MIELFTRFQDQLALSYTILIGRLYTCSLFEAIRLLSACLFLSLAVKLILHWRYKARLQRKALPASSPELLRIFAQAATDLGLTRLPKLALYPNERLPAFTVGSWRPTVFLSPTFVARLDPQELKAVISHELGHISRRDNLSTWLLEGLFAAMPLIVVGLLIGQLSVTWATCLLMALLTLLSLAAFRWLLRGWYRHRCELACDDHSIVHGTEPLALASSLLKAWQWMTGSAAQPAPLPKLHALLLGPTCLERRITRLVDYRGPGVGLPLEKALRGLTLALALYFGVFLVRYHLLDAYDRQIAHWQATGCCPHP